jgi:hypothetical protein
MTKQPSNRGNIRAAHKFDKEGNLTYRDIPLITVKEEAIKRAIVLLDAAVDDAETHIEAAALQNYFKAEMLVWPEGPPAALTHDCPTPDLCVCEPTEVSCLPTLTDAMYHAVRGLELEFGRGADGFVGTLNDDALDEIWGAINTALRVQP